jgi:hypothetical protein
MIIDIYRGDLVNVSFKATEETVFTHQLMGEHKITARFNSTTVLDIRIGDYITYDGETFTVNTAPQVTRRASRLLEYEVVFEGEVYRLYNKIFMDEGAADFSYFGTPLDYISLLLTNINEIDPGWTSGTVYDTVEPKHLSFNNETCREALTRIAEAFRLEYSFANREISMVQKVGEDIFLTLEYGKGKGLYNLTRQSLNDKNVITRLYAFGSEKNLSYDYRNGARRLIFTGNYLESNTALYGIIEHSITFDDIFPNRTGSVTAVDAADELVITDTGIDFDINSYLLEGVVAKIVFKTGALAGNQFEIVSYDHAAKKITFKALVEENDYTLPNDTVKPAVADEYTLVDIKMPQTYIDAAEASLQTKAQDYLDEHDHPVVSYGFECDEKFVRDAALDLDIGDRVHVVDTGLGIDTTLRISNISYPLLFPARVTAEITESLQYTTQERLIRVTAESRKQIREVNRSGVELSRLNNLRMRELQGMIFDPDGYFDTENIKPASIETIHLAVGVKSQQFVLSGIVFQPNQDSDVAKFAWSAGQLIHYEIEEAIRTWDISVGSLTGLLNSEAYYIYARCPVVGVQASIVVTTDQRKVDHEAGFYTFLVGVLHSVVDGVRGISLTYGTTEINGKFIRTGTIFSQDGLTYFDLDAGEIGGKISFAAGSSGYKNLSDLPGSNPHFEQEKKLWSNNDQGEEVQENANGTIVSEGNWGGKAIELVGYQTIYWKNAIPVDINRVYKGRFRVRQTVDPTDPAKANVYAGVACLDKDYVRLTELPGTHRWFIVAANLISVADGWKTYEAIITGEGGGSHSKFMTGTVYVRPVFYVNYQGGDGTAQVDGLEFFDITEAEEAEAAVSTLEAALGDMAYEDLVGVAKLDTTVIQGGYIKTSLIDVDTLIVSGDLETTAGAQTKADTAESAAIDYASSAVAQMTNAHFEQAKKLWSSNFVGQSVAENAPGTIVSGGNWGGKLLEITGPASAGWKNAIPVDVNRVYKGRFRVRQTVNPTTGGSNVLAGFMCLDSNYQIIDDGTATGRYFIVFTTQIQEVDSWQVFEGTVTGEGTTTQKFKAGTKYVRPFFIVNNLDGDGTAQVDGLEFFDITEAEEAEAAVSTLEAALGDMAYEDLVGVAKLDTTVIQGGYIKTSLIDVDTLIVDGSLETLSGAQDKADAAESAAIDYASSAVAQMANAHFEQGKKLWSTTQDGNSVTENAPGAIVATGSWGGKVLEMIGQVSLFYANAIPVDVNRTYKGRFRVRQTVDPTSGGSRVFAGVACLDKDYNPLNGTLGFARRYFVVNDAGMNTSQGWREFEGVITGAVADSHANFEPGTVYVRPVFIVNYFDGNGTAQIDGLEFFDITEAEEAEAAVSTLEAALGDMAYEDLVGLAKLDTTVIQGGYIKTSLIDVETLIAKHVLTASSGRRVHIDGDNNRMLFYDSMDDEIVRVDDNVGSDSAGNTVGGVVAKNSGDTRRSYISGAGVFSNASKFAFLSAATGIDTNASVVGLLFDRNGDSNGISAAVVGLDSTSTGNSDSWGGYFNSLFAGGLHVDCVRTSGSLALESDDCYVNCINSSAITVWLPSAKKVGHMVFIRRPSSPGVTVSGNGSLIMQGTTTSSSYAIPTGVNVFVWDGFYWLRSIMGW